MIGAIAGDIIGSVYEAHPIQTKAFPLFHPLHPRCRFTDDSVLTAAVAQAILTDGDSGLRARAKITSHRCYVFISRTFS